MSNTTNTPNNADQPLVPEPSRIRMAMLGMVPGNGHPYSWSAIINGQYDAEAMAQCGYAAIPQYLGAGPPDALGIAGAELTHVWCDNPEDTQHVAEAACIPNPVADPTDVIGKVDAVVIATDIGGEHVERARPFIEAGLPVFIDKPLTDNESDLRQFIDWWQAGRAILSTSCMRYAREFIALRDELPAVGDPRLVVCTMAKSWERYGIHAVEAVYHLLEPGGWRDVVNTGSSERNVVHLRHESGVDVLLPTIADLYGGFAHVTLSGTDGTRQVSFTDTLGAFRDQLIGWVDYLRTGRLPVPREQTIEQMKLIIAGLRSRECDGRRIPLTEINP